jgi:ankyrin repeat protein
MNYKQKVLKQFVKNNDILWVNRYATAELLNSKWCEDSKYEYLFGLRLFRYDLSVCMLKTLIQRGLNVALLVDHYGDNCLHHYCRAFGRIEIISLLVKCGVDINARGFNEHTPLSEALCNSHSEDRLLIVEALLEAGADVSRYLQRGRTIMQIAMFSSNASFAPGVIRCRMAKDAFVACAKKYGGVSRDMINLIGQFIWETRRAEEWK